MTDPMHMIRKLFRGWIEEGATRAVTPAVMQRTATLPGQRTGNLVFGGAGILGPGVSRSFATYREEEVMGLLCACPAVLDLITLAFLHVAARDFEPTGETWQMLEVRPTADLGLVWSGKPGDVDILVGPWRNGRPAFDWLAGCEVKVRTTRADGSPGNTRDIGRTQAAGLSRLGVDYAMLLHVLIAEHGVASDEASLIELLRETAMFGPNQQRTERAMLQQVVGSLGDRIGYAALWWNHEAGHGPAMNSSADLAPYRPPRRRLADLVGDQSRRALDDAARRVWERVEFAGYRLLRRCPKCHRLVGVDRRPITRCPRCAELWVPEEEVAMATDLRPAPATTTSAPGPARVKNRKDQRRAPVRVARKKVVAMTKKEVTLTFLSHDLEEVDPYGGVVIIRDTEMVIAVEETPDHGEYQIVGAFEDGYWSGVNTSRKRGAPRVTAAWAKIGARWVGVWTEDGFEYMFTIDDA